MIEFTITGRYKPDPEHYEHLGENPTEQEMMEYDRGGFEDGTYGADELLEFGEEPVTATWAVVPDDTVTEPTCNGPYPPER